MPDDRIQCLICGRKFLSVGPHLARSHRIAGADYLTEHQLPADTPLIAESLRRLLAQRRAATDADPVKADRGRRARSLAGRRTAPAAHQALRDAALAKVRAAGFASITDAVAGTRALTISGVARRLGVSESTVKRWRRTGGRAGLADPPPRHCGE
ncbi:MAG: MucR family transcriptional regulator [Actinomycetota bacterium]|nr:MucR family transcriptional regulator [Actinomycetota bacterium]